MDKEIIEAIADLPGLVLRSKGIIPELDDTPQGQLLKNICSEYKAIACWFLYHSTNNDRLLSSLSPSLKNKTEIAADFSRILYEIIQKIYSRVKIIIPPSQWYFLCEWELCEALLNNSGYFGHPILIGKTKAYELCCDLTKQIEIESSKIFISKNSILQNIENISAYQCVYFLGSWLKETDRTFIRHWNNFLASKRRIYREIRDNKEIKILYLDENKLQPFTRGKKRKNKKSGK